MRYRGDATKAAIKEKALEHFARSGYQQTSLEDVASDLGITRSAVLFHFRTKSDLLKEIAAPLESELERILGMERGEAPLSGRARKALIAELVDCYIAHRNVVVLITRDISSHAPIDLDPRIALRAQRLFYLLAGPDPTESDRLVMRALVGAVLNPLADPELDVEKQDVRHLLLETAMLIARRFGTKPRGA